MSNGKAGTTVELEAIYRSERSALLGLAYLLTGCRSTAEDLVQTAFAEAHARWDSVEKPQAYLRQVIVNRARDAQRRSFRRRILRDEEATTIPEIDETWRAIVRLPRAQRAVVVLRFYEDLSLVEIARILDRAPATVRSDLRRALERLKRTLP